MRLALAPLAGLALLASACAHGTSAAKHRCAPATVDAAFARFGTVYTPCDVDRAARLETRPPTGMDRQEVAVRLSSERLGPGAQRCWTATVDFVIDEEGRVIPESARVVRATDVAYGESVARSVAALRFTPAIKAGQPVRQVGRHMQGAAVVVRTAGSLRTGPPRC